MSVVVDMVLFLGAGDDEAEAVGRLNAWCAEHGRGQQFANLPGSAAGGFKGFASEVWAMAGNYFPWQDLVAALASFEWYDPDSVVLLVNASEYDYDHTLIFRPGERLRPETIDGEARDSPKEIEAACRHADGT